jgi:hypothetical protein
MAIVSIKNKSKSGSLLVGNTGYVPPAFESIATVTAAGGESSLTFSSIPATFTHLQIRGIGRNNSGNTTADSIRIRMNASSATDYTGHSLTGNGSTASTTGAATGGTSGMTFASAVAGSGQTASCFGVMIFDLLDYASTTKYKTARVFCGDDTNAGTTDNSLNIASSLWIQTTAVSSIVLISASGQWGAGSTYALYGIKAA